MKILLEIMCIALLAVVGPSRAQAQSTTVWDGELTGRVKTISSSFNTKDGHLYVASLERTKRGVVKISLSCDGHPSVSSEISEDDLEIKKPAGAPLGMHLWVDFPGGQCSKSFSLQVYSIDNIASEGPAVGMVTLGFQDGVLDLVRPTLLGK